MSDELKVPNFKVFNCAKLSTPAPVMLSKLKLRFNATTRGALFYNVAAAIITALLANAIIFIFGWDNESPKGDKFPIPGYVIGSVWILLFALMGSARWLLNFSTGPKAVTAKQWVTALITGCALYVFLLSVKSPIPGLIGNLVVIFFALLTFGKTYRLSKLASWLVAPVVVWVILATTLTVLFVL